MDTLVLAALALLVILLAAGGYLLWRKRPEVYYYGVPDPTTKSAYSFTLAEAGAQALALGGTLATLAQVSAAGAAGAQWCGWAWTADGVAAFPRRSTFGCAGQGGLNIQKAPATTRFGVAVYGVKPPAPPAGNCSGGPCIAYWFDGEASPAAPAVWSQYS